MTTTTPQAAEARATARAPTTPTGRRIVDAPMRMFHWLFALSFAGAYLSAEGEHWRALHITLGYTMLGLLVARVVYGLVGPAPARLNLLWRKFASAPVWLRGLLQAPPTATTWRQGQNLALAGTVLLLLGLTLPLAASGIASFHEWGDALGLTELWEELHEALGEGLLMVVLAHLGLILTLSLLRRRNLAAPMWSGRIEGVGPDLVRHNRAGLALLLLAAVLAWGAWEWQQSPQGLVTPAGLASLGSGHDGDDEDDD